MWCYLGSRTIARACLALGISSHCITHFLGFYTRTVLFHKWLQFPDPDIGSTSPVKQLKPLQYRADNLPRNPTPVAPIHLGIHDKLASSMTEAVHHPENTSHHQSCLQWKGPCWSDSNHITFCSLGTTEVADVTDIAQCGRNFMKTTLWCLLTTRCNIKKCLQV